MSAARTWFWLWAWSAAARFRNVLAVFLCLGAPVAFGGGSPWGADYFPSVELISHEGERVVTVLAIPSMGFTD